MQRLILLLGAFLLQKNANTFLQNALIRYHKLVNFCIVGFINIVINAKWLKYQ